MEIKIYSKKHGTFTMLINEEDYYNLPNKIFHISKSGNRFYAQDSNRNFVHQLIGGKADGMVIDHINGNSLDNRRENLRLTTSSINNKNRKGYGTIPYKFMSSHTRYDRKTPRTLYEVKFPNTQHRQFSDINEAKAYYIECLMNMEGGLYE